MCQERVGMAAVLGYSSAPLCAGVCRYVEGVAYRCEDGERPWLEAVR